MKALVCEMCNSNDLIKQDGYFVCQNCGTKYSVEEAKKMMIDGVVDVSGSTIKVDNSKELDNLHELARRAKEADNSEKAAEYYGKILIKDPSSWEANFYSIYYSTLECRVAQIKSAATTLANSIDGTVSLVKNQLKTEEEQSSALTEMMVRCSLITNLLWTSSWNRYEPHGYSNNPQYFYAESNPAISIMSELGNSIEKHFTISGKIETTWINVRKLEVNFKVDQLLKYYSATDEQYIQALISRIQERDSEYDPPKYNVNSKKSSGCYVATCVYGSYDCPQVWTLRRYRDYQLAETWYGRAFIRIYYAISPTLVKWFGHTNWFKNMWRGTLDRMVSNLQADGVEDTPYIDKEW